MSIEIYGLIMKKMIGKGFYQQYSQARKVKQQYIAKEFPELPGMLEKTFKTLPDERHSRKRCDIGKIRDEDQIKFCIAFMGG